MAQLLVRRIDEELNRRLQERALRHGVSIEEEARNILHAELLKPMSDDQFGLGSRVAKLFENIPGNDEPLPELPDLPLDQR